MTWKNAYNADSCKKKFKKKNFKYVHTAESAAAVKLLTTLELLLNSDNNNKRHE